MTSAGELADILEALIEDWNASSNAYTNLGTSSPGDLAFWRGRARAAVLWDDIDQYLTAREQAGRNVDHHRQALVPALRAVFHPDQNWTVQGGAPDVRVAVAQLRGLDDLIAERAGSEPLTESRQNDLRGLLDEIVALLGDPEETLDEHERRYLLELVRSMTQLLDERTVIGEADLRSIVDRLVGALTALSLNLAHAGRPNAARRVMGLIVRMASTTRVIVADANAFITLTNAIIGVLNPGHAPDGSNQIES